MGKRRFSVASQSVFAVLLLSQLGYSQTAEESLMKELEGISVEAKADIEKWKAKADAGDIKAQLELAQSYMAIIPGTHASKIPPLRKRAYYWYEQAIFNPVVKERKDESALKISLMAEKELTYSLYLEKDEAQLRRLAEKKLPEAHYQLAELLIRNDPNSDEAMKWLLGLGKVKHLKATERLADQYSNAFIKHYDVKKSFEWHEKAAVKGDPKYIFELAKMYHHGFGDKWPEFQKDQAKANKLYGEAATYGNSDAQAYLIQPLLNNKDYKSAIVLSDALMKNGRAEGYYHKSRILYNGWGITADKAAAIQLMKKAKEKGYFLAEIELDSMQEGQ
ncbi:MAG: tetratricopeptide repeat protein [Luteolibacter sp.]